MACERCTGKRADHEKCDGMDHRYGLKCNCICRLPSTTPVRTPKPIDIAEDDLAWLYTAMREEGVKVWYTHDYRIRFTPRDISPSLRKDIRKHHLELMLTLAPWGDDRTGVGRQSWLVGQVAPCYCCGQMVASRDPLDNPRCPSCGWLPGHQPGPQHRPPRSQVAPGAHNPGQALLERTRRLFGPSSTHIQGGR